MALKFPKIISPRYLRDSQSRKQLHFSGVNHLDIFPENHLKCSIIKVGVGENLFVLYDIFLYIPTISNLEKFNFTFNPWYGERRSTQDNVFFIAAVMAAGI